MTTAMHQTHAAHVIAPPGSISGTTGEIDEDTWDKWEERAAIRDADRYPADEEDDLPWSELPAWMVSASDRLARTAAW